MLLAFTVTLPFYRHSIKPTSSAKEELVILTLSLPKGKDLLFAEELVILTLSLPKGKDLLFALGATDLKVGEHLLYH